MRQQKEVTNRERFASALLCLALALGILLTLDLLGYWFDLGDWSDFITSFGLIAVSLALTWTWLRVSHIATQIDVLKVQIRHIQKTV